MSYESETAVTIIRGDTWDGIAYTVTKAAVDYTGATIRADFRNLDGVSIFRKSITASTAESGQIIFTVSLTKTETENFYKTVYCDIEITTVAGSRKTPIGITFTVTDDVTRDYSI